MTPEQKKVLAKDRNDYNLHVSLIKRQDDVTQSVAQFRAWLEGKPGLAARLNPQPKDNKQP